MKIFQKAELECDGAGCCERATIDIALTPRAVAKSLNTSVFNNREILENAVNPVYTNNVYMYTNYYRLLIHIDRIPAHYCIGAITIQQLNAIGWSKEGHESDPRYLCRACTLAGVKADHY